ncbi:sulfotransferase [Limibacillus sp. MBR-115]|jgi:tetratricopeptide (TPR) repeat protein|uniref:tetratricopeptide repeat-containing sulfotransferase family protein n=1 Tax=Limibacillus sp. MBR-115 TaxID=3156465 RepID=UPI00339B3B11
MVERGKEGDGGLPFGGLEPSSALSRAGDLLREGRTGEAEAVVAAALESVPGHVELLAALGELRLRQGRAAEALEPLKKAAKKAPQALALQNNLATALRLCGEAVTAEQVIRKALAGAGRDPAATAMLHATLGSILLERGKPGDALASFDKAAAGQPNNPQVQVSRGICLRDLGRTDEALAALDKALAAHPGFGSAFYQKLLVLERASRLESAQSVAAIALKKVPDHPGVLLTTARLYRRLGRKDEAVAMLEGMKATGDFAYERPFQLGRLYDEMDRPADAFAAFSEGNRLQSETVIGRATRKERFLERIAKLEETVTAEWVAGWQPLAQPDDWLRDPVFLVGFPRSGTTLLDQILSGHSDIEVIEEQPLLESLRKKMDSGDPGYPERLSTLSVKDAGRLRTLYSDALKEALAQSGCTGTTAIRVDKFPFNLLDLPLIMRLFPQSKVIMALRHPCDVVLSCFMQQFQLNNAMAHFLNLEDAAELYARVMALGRRYETLLSLPLHRLRYEDLVTDTEGQARKLLTFLELPWQASVLDHVATAKARHIATPSYEQVTQPIYKHASGRWHRYEEQLSPLLPILQPSIDAYGYTID